MASNPILAMIFGGGARREDRAIKQQQLYQERMQTETMDRVRNILSDVKMNDWDKVDALQREDPTVASAYLASMKEEGKQRAISNIDVPEDAMFGGLWAVDPGEAATLTNQYWANKKQQWEVKGQALDYAIASIGRAAVAFQNGDARGAMAWMKAGGMKVDSLEILPRDKKTGLAMMKLNGEVMSEMDFRNRHIIEPKQKYQRETEILLQNMRNAASIAKTKMGQETTPKEADKDFVFNRLESDPEFDGMDSEEKSAAADTIAIRIQDLRRGDPKYVDYETAYQEAKRQIKQEMITEGGSNYKVFGWLPIPGTSAKSFDPNKNRAGAQHKVGDEVTYQGRQVIITKIKDNGKFEYKEK